MAQVAGANPESALLDFLENINILKNEGNILNVTPYMSYCKDNSRAMQKVTKSTAFWDITPCSPLKVNREQRSACHHAGFLLGLFFDHEDGGDMSLRNIG
jgi:hypothetical protein